MSARDEILARVRGAVSDITAPVGARGPVPVIEAELPGREETVELFVDRVVDYQATVVRAAPDHVGAAVAGAVANAGASSVVVPDGLDPSWTAELGDGIRTVSDEQLASAELDDVDAVVTACAVGIATTGTIVLDHGADQGRRALSLVPDMHVCVVRVDQVVHDVPEARSLGCNPVTVCRARSPGSRDRAPPATSSWTVSRACTGRAACTSSWSTADAGSLGLPRDRPARSSRGRRRCYPQRITASSDHSMDEGRPAARRCGRRQQLPARLSVAPRG